MFSFPTYTSYTFVHSPAVNGFFFNFWLLVAKLVKLAKRLKKEKVNVDIINFGEEVSIGAEARSTNRNSLHRSI